jgi:hypothetical protein
VPAQPFGTEEFARRAARQARADGSAARTAMGAVLATARDAVEPGEFDDVLAQLGPEYAELVRTARCPAPGRPAPRSATQHDQEQSARAGYRTRPLPPHPAGIERSSRHDWPRLVSRLTATAITTVPNR